MWVVRQMSAPTEEHYNKFTLKNDTHQIIYQIDALM